ncbi:MAG TPA: ribose 5-phosphate isomerase B [Candidatus Olsenella stercoravium]|uniref:Ribose 5-phosphate isomerase B n=1 Tax=Candidatus Olsenella stercoravium TaxID=2838713 RepID=A0A9D2DJ30_9ACTN|nr:ribose 5-phosphate isomerase B [Candidatus Olsenella stercoravium]
MRIAIASDHAGFIQKDPLADYLRSRGHEVVDCGPSTDARCDYPDFADKVARLVARGEVDRGVLICGTGLGIAMAADKVAGVRACPIQTVEFARLCREHNDANVIGLSGRFVSLEDNEAILDAFLSTDFEGGRHTGRVEKMMREDDPDFPGVPLDLGM